MNKAILVIDMPESCDKCPLMFRHEEERGCIPERRNSFSIKPSWCPLKPVPSSENFYKSGSVEDKVKMFIISDDDKDLFVVDYDKKEGLYRVSFFDENNHYIDEVCFKEYEE